MGNFSRDTFDKLKHYVGVRLQQGVPLVDADWNEQEDIRKYELQAFLKWFIGNGVPYGNDGFRILTVTNRAQNDFIIKGGDGTPEGAGRCIVEGLDVVIESDIMYTEQALYDKDLALKLGVEPISPLTTPTADRTDLVYLDVWEREVDSEEDENIVNPAIGIETCVRIKREWAVRVAEGKTELPVPTQDHVFCALARLEMKEERMIIEDLRKMCLNPAALHFEIQTHDHDGLASRKLKHSMLELNDGRNPHGTTTDDLGALPKTGGSISGNLAIQGELKLDDGLRMGANGQLSVDAPDKPGERLIVLEDGNIGIGTKQPGGKLEIAQSGYYTRLTGNQIIFNRLNNEDSYIQKDDNGAIQFRMGPFESKIIPLVIRGSNVGIGTAKPQTMLDVNGDITVRGKNLLIGRSRNVDWADIVATDSYGNLNLRPARDLDPRNPNDLSMVTGVFVRDGNTTKGIRLYGGDPINHIQSLDLRNYDDPKLTDPVYFKPADLLLQPDGANVLIGSTRIQSGIYRLDVSGKIFCDSIDFRVADYAEYFESSDGKEIPIGTSVMLEDGKIKPAVEGKTPIGIISASPGLIGGIYREWPKKYLKDELGSLIMEEYQEEVMVPKKEIIKKERQKLQKRTIDEEVIRTEVVYKDGKYCQVVTTEILAREIEEPIFKEVDLYDSTGENVIGNHQIPVMELYEEEVDILDENGWPVLVGSGEFITKQRPKLNPEYNESREYKPRQDRPEWNCVGLLGQLPLIKGQPVADNWSKIKDISENVELWLVK